MKSWSMKWAEHVTPYGGEMHKDFHRKTWILGRKRKYRGHLEKQAWMSGHEQEECSREVEYEDLAWIDMA